VRKRGEDEVDPVEGPVKLFDDRIRVRARKMRVHSTDRLPGLAVAEQFRGRELGMRGDEPEQLAPNIA
jgi:hypothetical protein